MSRGVIVILFTLLLGACSQGDQATFTLESASEKWNRPAKTWKEDELRILFKGELLYDKTCSVCHGRRGTGDMQIGAVALKGSLMTNKVDELIRRVLLGKKGTMMPAFSASLSDREIASILSYVRNAWGNDADELVPVAIVTRLR